MGNIFSMTGYGKATLQLPSKKISFEVKSLNSKQTDISIRVPSFYKEKEGEIRQAAAEVLQRGKIEAGLYSEVTGVEKAPIINVDFVNAYLEQLKSIGEKAQVNGDILGIVMRLPDAMKPAETEIDETEWSQIQSVVKEALKNLMDFRQVEGEKLKKDFLHRTAIIRSKMNGTTDFEADRVARVKERLTKGLAEITERPDENRYEQELIYYLEKLDITEEKVRLKSHLDYFEELIEEGGAIGKKLGFISQEIGREVNTMGSKANHAGMQKLVVEMKDELEKIKEQVLNIL